MTETQIKNLIQHNLGLKGAEGARTAKNAYNAAIEHVATLDYVPWNKEGVEFDLTAGTSEYNIGETILGDYPETRGISQLWHTDEQNRPVTLLAPEQFNTYARGSVTTGKPYVATIFGKKKTLSFYYIPDSDYTIWGYLRFPLTIGDIPEEYKKILLWTAIMIAGKRAAYLKAQDMLSPIIRELQADGLMKWDGSRIIPEFMIGGSSRYGSGADSTNRWGLIGW